MKHFGSTFYSSSVSGTGPLCVGCVNSELDYLNSLKLKPTEVVKQNCFRCNGSGKRDVQYLCTHGFSKSHWYCVHGNDKSANSHT